MAKRLRIPRTEGVRERDRWRLEQDDDNSKKIDKVVGAPEDNIPVFDDEGGLKDSGKSFDDVQLKKQQTRTVTGNYTVVVSDVIIWVDASGGPVTVTLLSAAGITGQDMIIEKIDSTFNEVTVAADGSETINGDPSFDLLLQYESIQPTSTGAGWLI